MSHCPQDAARPESGGLAEDPLCPQTRDTDIRRLWHLGTWGEPCRQPRPEAPADWSLEQDQHGQKPREGGAQASLESPRLLPCTLGPRETTPPSVPWHPSLAPHTAGAQQTCPRRAPSRAGHRGWREEGQRERPPPWRKPLRWGGGAAGTAPAVLGPGVRGPSGPEDGRPAQRGGQRPRAPRLPRGPAGLRSPNPSRLVQAMGGWAPPSACDSAQPPLHSLGLLTWAFPGQKRDGRTGQSLKMATAPHILLIVRVHREESSVCCAHWKCRLGPRQATNCPIHLEPQARMGLGFTRGWTHPGLGSPGAGG